MYAHAHEANQFEYALKIITVLRYYGVFYQRARWCACVHISYTGLMYAHTGKSIILEHALKWIWYIHVCSIKEVMCVCISLLFSVVRSSWHWLWTLRSNRNSNNNIHNNWQKVQVTCMQYPSIHTQKHTTQPLPLMCERDWSNLMRWLLLPCKWLSSINWLEDFCVVGSNVVSEGYCKINESW